MITKPYRILFDGFKEVRVGNLPAAMRAAKKLDVQEFSFERWNYEQNVWLNVSDWSWNEALGRYAKPEPVYVAIDYSAERERLENHPEIAAALECFRCGKKIGDAEYRVNVDAVPSHAVCGVS